MNVPPVLATIGVTLIMLAVFAVSSKFLGVEVSPRAISARIAIGLVGALFVVLSAWLLNVSVQPKTPSLEEQVSTLGNTLQDAARAIDKTEEEIAARQRLVDKLRQDQERYEALSQLNKAQVDAIAATLQGQLDQSERRARLATWLLLPSWGALLGLLLAVAYERLIRRRRKVQSPPDAEPSPGGS